MENRGKKSTQAIPRIVPAPQSVSPVDVRYYEHLVNIVSDAIVSLHTDMTIKSWNRAAEQAYGWSAAQALGKNAMQLLNVEFPGSNFTRRFKELMAAGRLEFEMVHTARDGRKIIMLTNMTLMRGEDGKITDCVAVLRDITERKRQEEELARTKRLLENELNAMNRLHRISTLFVQEEDLHSLLGEIICAAMEITGARICLILATDARTGRTAVVAQQGLPRDVVERVERIHNRPETVRAVLRLGGGMVLEDMSSATTSMTGKARDELKKMGMETLQGTPLMSRSGKMLGMLSTVFNQPHCTSSGERRMLDMLARLTADILERSQAAEALWCRNRDAELQYGVLQKLLAGGETQKIVQEICERVTEYLDCGVFMNYLFTPDHTGLRLNACAGIPMEFAGEFEFIGKGQGICGGVAETGRAAVLEDIGSCKDARVDSLFRLGVRAYACHPLMADSEVLGILSFGAVNRDAFTQDEVALIKSVCGHVAVAIRRMQYEADLKRLTEELGDKNRLITEFFTNISHEFKTPLSIILVDLQLMEYRLRGVDDELRIKLGKSIAVMRQNALRLLRLIGNLLDVTKIDAGFMSARLVDADAVEVARGIAESVGDYAREAGLEVRFESDCRSLRMPLDVEKMERILLNLLSNAIKHTAAGGHIRVGLRSRHGSVLLSVKDDGEGIPAGRQEIIFDRFRQVNTSLTRASEGCGIGLSLTKALVELLQGRVWFESREGLGSEFFVELPVLAAGTETSSMEIDGMPRSRKVEMEFSDIHKQ